MKRRVYSCLNQRNSVFTVMKILMAMLRYCFSTPYIADKSCKKTETILFQNLTKSYRVVKQTFLSVVWFNISVKYFHLVATSCPVLNIVLINIDFVVSSLLPVLYQTANHFDKRCRIFKV